MKLSAQPYVLLFFLCTFLPLLGFSQQPDFYFDWVYVSESPDSQTPGPVAVAPDKSIVFAGNWTDSLDILPGQDTSWVTEGRGAYMMRLTAEGEVRWTNIWRTDGGTLFIRGLDTDSSGNIFGVGFIRGVVDMDPGPQSTLLTSIGLDDPILFKMDSLGSLVWAISFPNTGAADLSRIDVGQDLSLHMVGRLSGDMTLVSGNDTIQLSSVFGTADILIIKCSQHGEVEWAKVIGNSRGDYGRDIDSDPNGNVYATGYFVSDVDFDPGPGIATLSSPFFRQDAFVLKLDSDGNFLWARDFGGTADEFGYAIAVSADSDVYTTGYFTSNLFTVGDSIVDTVASEASASAFLLKYDSEGNYQWNVALDTSTITVGEGVIIGQNEDPIFLGIFRDSIDLGPGPDTTIVGSEESQSIYFVKYSKDGDYLWGAGYWNDANQYLRGYAADQDDHLYLSGEFSLVDSISFPLASGISVHQTPDFGDREFYLGKVITPQIATSLSRKQEVDIRYFPNPSSGILYVTTPTEQIQSAELYNSLGQLIACDVVKTANGLRISTPFKGMAFLRVKSSETTVIQQVLFME